MSRANNERRNILKARYLESSGYKNSEIRKMQAKNQVTGILFTLAPVVVMGLFVFLTFIIGLVLTTYKGKMDLSMDQLEPVGMNNFKLMFQGKDPMLKSSIMHTLEFMGVNVAVSVLGSIFMAFLLNSGKVYGKKALLTMYFLPQVTSASASTIIFYTLFSKPLDVGMNPDNKFLIVIFAGVWIQVAGSIIIFNTSFTNIGKTEYEAAKLDGANSWTRFWKITLPSLAPVIAYQFMMTLIVGMGAFGESYMMIKMGYARPEDVATWASLGFMHVQGDKTAGIIANVGLGIAEMLTLAIATLALSLIGNWIQPINGRKKRG